MNFPSRGGPGGDDPTHTSGIYDIKGGSNDPQFAPGVGTTLSDEDQMPTIQLVIDPFTKIMKRVFDAPPLVIDLVIDMDWSTFDFFEEASQPVLSAEQAFMQHMMNSPPSTFSAPRRHPLPPPFPPQPPRARPARRRW